jgi:glc operon protein GlcG
MNKMKLKVLVMLLVGFQAFFGMAQPAPDPADDIPDVMPFDLALGTPIT